jgi:hypothetical protein
LLQILRVIAPLVVVSGVAMAQVPGVGSNFSEFALFGTLGLAAGMLTPLALTLLNRLYSYR